VFINGEAVNLVAATASQLVFVIVADAAIGPAKLDLSWDGQSVSKRLFSDYGCCC